LHKLNKSAIGVKADSQMIDDPDESQLLDECNYQWVKAWKVAVEKSTELKPQLVCHQSMHRTTR